MVLAVNKLDDLERSTIDERGNGGLDLFRDRFLFRKALSSARNGVRDGRAPVLMGGGADRPMREPSSRRRSPWCGWSRTDSRRRTDPWS